MIIAIIQARMGSSRLPRKVMKPLCGQPVIWHIVRLAHAVPSIQKVVVATTTSEKDNKLADYLIHNDIEVFRGSEDDVLGRYSSAARIFNAKIVIRLTADNPLVDPAVVERVIGTFVEEGGHFDYVSNTNPITFPCGLNTEVFSIEALQKADTDAVTSYQREHVTPYFYQNPNLFKLYNVECKKDLSHHRWTLDNKEDYDFLSRIYTALYNQDKIIRMDTVLKWLQCHPEVQNENR